MAAILPQFRSGPKTYIANSAITGGQVVQLRTDGLIEPAAAGSVTVLGVAQADAAPRADTFATSNGVFNGAVNVPSEVAVYSADIVPVTYAANCNPGVRLKAAANGQVTPWVSGTDTDAALIIGHCEAAAAVSSGAVAPARINL